jgi:hypothetical protein
MRPGGRSSVLRVCIAAASSCLMAASASSGEAPACTAQGISFNAPVVSGCSAARSDSFELKAEASDRGAYWFGAGDGQPGPANLTPTGESEINRAVTFRSKHAADVFGEIELYGGVGKVETTDALTFARLQWADGWRQDSTSLGVGAVERLFDGRLVVATSLSWSQSDERWQSAFVAPASSARDGGARWHRVEAKLFDAEAFKWSVKGDMSVVDDGYVGNAASKPSGTTTALRGERSALSTQVAVFGANVSASIEHHGHRMFVRDATSVQVEFDGLATTVFTKDIQRGSYVDPTLWTSRTALTGVSFDITPQLLAPEWVGGSALVPTLVSLSGDSGTAVTPDGAGSAERIGDFEVLAMWKTVLGDTTALYSSGQQGREITGLGYAGDSERMFDISQSFKTGNWRFSAGASASVMGNSSTADAFGDDAVSGRFAVRYAPARGPQFEASLGRHHDDFEMESLELSLRSRATTLSASLDLSEVVQRRLQRDDVQVKFDYRHRLRQSEVSQALTGSESAHSSDAALLSFSMPLQAY